MNKVIYIPTINIRDESWLLSTYFLWERLYRISPEGIPPRQTRLEKQILKHDPRFIRKADHTSHIASSVLIYQNITEAICSETLPQKEFLDILKWTHEQSVLIYSEKTDQSLVELWEYYGILQQKTRKGYHIPQFWSDLWLVVLALQIGRQDKLEPVSDQPLAGELIRLCHQFDPETGQLLLTHPTPQSQVKNMFFKIGLPAFGVAKAKSNTDTDLKKWKQIKQEFKPLRDEYHQLAGDLIKEIPLCLEKQRSLETLVKELRNELDKGISGWQERFKKCGLWLSPWILTAWFQYAAAPGQLTAITQVASAIATGKVIHDILRGPCLKQPFLYEYHIGKQIS